MSKTQKLTGISLFTALVVVLQLLGSFIRFGQFSISLVLIPIVVGAALYGAVAGAWLGFSFGLTVLLSGDASVFLAVNPLGTVAVVLAKGILAGLAAGLIYKLLEKFNMYAAVMAAAILCPAVNSGVFLLGCKLFFMETISGWAKAANFTGSPELFIILVLIGLNFVFELALNVVLSPVILRLIKIGRKEK